MITSCSSTKNEKLPPNTETIKTVTSHKLGSGVGYLFNNSKTYVICLKKSKPTPNFPQSQIHFLVYDISEEEIIYENKIEGGEIQWVDDERVEIKMTPGIVSGDEDPNDFIQIYDVKLKKRIQ
jgi:hypothetical protein